MCLLVKRPETQLDRGVDCYGVDLFARRRDCLLSGPDWHALPGQSLVRPHQGNGAINLQAALILLSSQHNVIRQLMYQLLKSSHCNKMNGVISKIELENFTQNRNHRQGY